MIKTITSSQNATIKRIRSLDKKKNRHELGLFVIEGIRFVESAVEHNAELHEIFFTEDFQDSQRGRDLIDVLEARGLPLFMLDKKVFESLADTVNSQGIIASVRFDKTSNVNLFDKKYVLLLDRIQDPGNLGTIIRTADCAGLEAVILAKGTVDPYNSKTLRSTMGSIFTMPIVQTDDVMGLISELRSNGFSLATTSLAGDRFYDEIDYGESVVLVIGNEGSGVSDDILAVSDIKVKIPIYGHAESLNASIAAGIMMYEIAKNFK